MNISRCVDSCLLSQTDRRLGIESSCDDTGAAILSGTGLFHLHHISEERKAPKGIVHKGIFTHEN
eukprot:529453-Amphidinium_carterae.1